MKSQDKEPERDPFMCSCQKCQRFWAVKFGTSADLLQKPPLDRSANTSIMYKAVRSREDHPAVLKVGDRVLMHEKHKGTIKYVGLLEDSSVAPSTYIGIKLDDQVGSLHNGVHKGKRYFHCPRGHGAMVKYSEVVRINPAEKHPPISGNYMFPSYREILKRRKERQEKDPSLEFGALYKRQSATNKHAFSSKAKHSNRNRTNSHQVESSDEEKTDEAQRLEGEPPQELLAKWQSKFGGGKQGERKARTLFKLKAAYEKGLDYKYKEDRGELTDVESDEEPVNMEHDREKLKAKSAARKQRQAEVSVLFA